LRRRPRLRRARGGRPASSFFQGLQAEIQIAAQLFHLGAHLPIIIVSNIKAPAQAAVFFLKLLHTTQQLLHQIARSSRTSRRRAWRGHGPATANRLKLAPQIQNLVLQRNPFAAFNLRLDRGRKSQPKTQKHDPETEAGVRHGQ
jgi:hypothetical protein